MSIVAKQAFHDHDLPHARQTDAGARPSSEVPWYLDGREVLLVLRSRLWLVLAPALALLAVAVVVLLALPPQYVSTAQLLIDPQGVQVLKDDLKPATQASDASLLLVDSDALVLSSDDVLRAVVDRFGLDHDPEFDRPPGPIARVTGAIAGLLGGSGPPTDPKLAALRSLRDSLSTQRLERSFVLAVSVTTDDRELSKRLAQGIVEEYLTVEAANRADVARRASGSLVARLDELQKSLRSAEDEAQAFRTANNLIGTRTQLVSEQQLGQISDQLGAARARASEQLSRLKQIEAALASNDGMSALPEVLQSATVGQLRTQLALTERALADDQLNLGARHPALIAAKTQVQAARAQLEGEIRRIGDSVRSEYRATMANVASLQQRLDRGKSEAVSVGDSMVQLRELEQKVEARRNLYGNFLARSRELQEQQQVDSSATRIISPATLPAQRKGPSKILVLLAVLVLGLGLGVVSALVADAKTRRIRTRRRFIQTLGLPVLGVLPPGGREGARDGTTGDYDLAVAHVGDQLREALTRASPRVLVVTDADGVSGKALLALSLAGMAAFGRERVLLIDADPDASVAATCGVTVQPETPAIRDGRLVVQDVRLAGFSNLRLLTADRLSPRIDHRDAIETVFKRAVDNDLVVVNAGRLGADLFTDRLVGDRRASLVLLAASAERSTFGRIERALSRTAACPVLACVLTDASWIDA